MKLKSLGLIALIGIIGILYSCRTAPPAPHGETNVSDFTRNNCYSLLYQLLGDEKDVSKLRFIKREDSELKQLLIEISKAAREAHAQLETFAKQDRTLDLELVALPAGEVATRKDIAAAEQHLLLHESGAKLELDLLLTQTDALRYGTHLAKVAGENDFNPARSRYLAGLSAQLQSFHDLTVAMLSLRNPPPEKK